MANLRSNDKNSIKLIIQAYASILEAFPEFFDLYQEYHINTYKLTDVTIQRNRSFERDLMHDDRMVVVTADTQSLGEFSVKLREKGIQAEFVGVGAFGPEFKAYSENVLVARYIDYEGIQDIKSEYLAEIEKQLEEEQKALEEAEELERDIEESLQEEPEEAEEEPVEEEESPEEDEDSPVDDDFYDKKKKKRENKESDIPSYVPPTEETTSYESENKGSDTPSYVPNTEDISSYESPFENKKDKQNKGSSENNASFETSQGTNLRDVTLDNLTNDEIKAEDSSQKTDSTIKTTPKTQEAVRKPDEWSNEYKESQKKSPYETKTDGSYRNVTGASSDEPKKDITENKTYEPYRSVTEKRVDEPGKDLSEKKTGFGTTKATNLKDVTEENLGKTGTVKTISITPDIVKKFDEIRDQVKGTTKRFESYCKDRFGGRANREDPFKKKEEKAEENNPNYRGRNTSSVKLEELKEIKRQIDERSGKIDELNSKKERISKTGIYNFDSNSAGTKEKDVFSQGVNVNEWAFGNGNGKNPFNTKTKTEENRFTQSSTYANDSLFASEIVKTHTIDFTKEIMMQRTINTFKSLSDMKSVHKVGKIAGRVAMNAVMSGSDGQQVLRECYMYASPMMNYAMGCLLAHGAMVNGAHTNISAGVFKNIFDEYMDVIGENSSLNTLKNNLLFDKLIHKSFADYTDTEIMQYFHIGKDKVGDFRSLQEKILKGVNINDADIIKKFGIDKKTLESWKSLMKGVNVGETNSLMSSLMGTRNGGFLNMVRRFSDQNIANIICNMKCSDEAKKILLGMKKENIFDQAFLDDIMKKLKRVSSSEEAQQFISLLKAANQERLFRMPKFSQLMGSYFMLVSMKVGEALRDTDFGHGLRSFTQTARGLRTAYNSLINLINAYAKGVAKISIHASVKATQVASFMEKAKAGNVAKAVAKRFGFDNTLAKFGSKASAKLAGYLAKTSVGTAAKALVGKITSTAAYQAVSAAVSSASATLAGVVGSISAVFWYVVLIVFVVACLTSLISMLTNFDDPSDSGSKNGTLANGIIADETDLLAMVKDSLEEKNKNFSNIINESLNNRQNFAYQVGSVANENVTFYEAERVVFRDAYGNELEPNHVDLNNTEDILSMASRYIPYTFRNTVNLKGDDLLAEQEIRQYFIDYCEFLWAATHQITIEEYRPGNSATQVTGTDDAQDTSGMVTDAVTGACPEDGKVMWLQEDYTPNIVTEYDDDGNELSQQCSSCDVPITNGTGSHKSGLCSHPRDDDLDVTPRIDGWRKTEEWRWGVNCLNGYSSKGHGDHTHKVLVGYDDQGDPEYDYEFEECMLSSGSYGDNKTYPKDSNGLGGSFHIHENDHIHKEYKWVYECGGHMGVVIYVTIGNISRLPGMKPATDIDYDKVGKYVDYDPDALKVHRSSGGLGRINAISTGTNYGIQDPFKGQAWPDLTDDEIRRITAGCLSEQGSYEGVLYEASLLANICDKKSIYGDNPKAVINSGWFAPETHDSYSLGYSVNGGTITQEMLDAVSRILRGGERITHADEHDCFSDIYLIEVNGRKLTSRADIENRDNYIPGETIIHRKGEDSVYKFMTFARNDSDPFGTTDLTFTYNFTSSTGILDKVKETAESEEQTTQNTTGILEKAQEAAGKEKQNKKSKT